MKLVYKCAHCGEAIAIDMPASPFPITPNTVLAAYDGDDAGLLYVPTFRKWIRHPCGPGAHGIAPLVAVIE